MRKIVSDLRRKNIHRNLRTATILIMVVTVTTTMAAAGCKKKNKKITPVCDGSTVAYNTTVKAIIDSKCLSCHSGFSTYSGLQTILSNGKFNQRVLVDQDMPKKKSLSADQLNKIKCWVDAGYPEN